VPSNGTARTGDDGNPDAEFLAKLKYEVESGRRAVISDQRSAISDHDIARAQRKTQELLYIGQECFAIGPSSTIGAVTAFTRKPAMKVVIFR